MLQWMQAQSLSCVLDELSTIAAASLGHLAVLQWLADKGCRVDGDLCHHAALAHPPRKSILHWLRDQEVSVPAALPDPALLESLKLAEPPVLMLLGELGAALPVRAEQLLIKARKRSCTFHGLLRWIRRAVSDLSRGAQSAFDHLAVDYSGQYLLVSLAVLPQRLPSWLGCSMIC